MISVIAVTGGIGSGKSEACRILSDQGYPVYDSDSRVKMLYDTVPGLVCRIEDELGEVLRTDDGRLDKRKLAGIVFRSEEALRKLESIVYPELMEDFKAWTEGRNGIVIFESAIILQKLQFIELPDSVIEIVAQEELRIKRTGLRDGLTSLEVKDRIKNQNTGERYRNPDFIIENNSDMESLKSELLSLPLFR